MFPFSQILAESTNPLASWDDGLRGKLGSWERGKWIFPFEREQVFPFKWEEMSEKWEQNSKIHGFCFPRELSLLYPGLDNDFKYLWMSLKKIHLKKMFMCINIKQAR